MRFLLKYVGVHSLRLADINIGNILNVPSSCNEHRSMCLSEQLLWFEGLENQIFIRVFVTGFIE